MLFVIQFFHYINAIKFKGSQMRMVHMTKVELLPKSYLKKQVYTVIPLWDNPIKIEIFKLVCFKMMPKYIFVQLPKMCKSLGKILRLLGGCRSVPKHISQLPEFAECGWASSCRKTTLSDSLSFYNVFSYGPMLEKFNKTSTPSIKQLILFLVGKMQVYKLSIFRFKKVTPWFVPS